MSPVARGWQLKEGKAPLLSSCALGRQVEQLLRRVELLTDGELFLHLDITDAVGERGDDGLIRDLGDLEAGVIEALDVLLEGLPGCCLIRRRSPAAGGRSRVPWKLATKRSRISSQEEIEPCCRFRSQERAPSLRAMGNQFAMTFSSSLVASMLSS